MESKLQEEARIRKILNEAHYYALKVRINGEDRIYQASFLKPLLNHRAKNLVKYMFPKARP